MIEIIRNRLTNRVWPWVFMIIFVVHLTEEFWAGVSLSADPNRIRGANLTPAQFIILTGFGVLLMTLGLIIAKRFSFLEWIMVCLGAIIFVNGLVHIFGSMRLVRYTPGLITGILLFIPLGAVTLLSLKGNMSARRYWLAFSVGILIHIAVLFLARNGGKLFAA